jgi:hypothetical protein
MTTPPLEFVPFAHTTAGAALAALGLTLIAKRSCARHGRAASCETSPTLIAIAVF